MRRLLWDPDELEAYDRQFKEIHALEQCQVDDIDMIDSTEKALSPGGRDRQVGHLLCHAFGGINAALALGAV